MSRSAYRRLVLARRAERLRPVQLHIFTFHLPVERGYRRTATVLVRGKMGANAAIEPAYEQATTLGHGAPFCVDIRTVPAPRPTPRLDALCQQLTGFTSFLALLTATAGYRPSIRLDLLGREGAFLARAYDRVQSSWGDPRRAFVTGEMPVASAAA